MGQVKDGYSLSGSEEDSGTDGEVTIIVESIQMKTKGGMSLMEMRWSKFFTPSLTIYH